MDNDYPNYTDHYDHNNPTDDHNDATATPWSIHTAYNERDLDSINIWIYYDTVTTNASMHTSDNSADYGRIGIWRTRSGG